MIKQRINKLKVNNICKNIIKEIYNLNPIKATISSTNKTSLVIFDIDDVLITHSSEDDFRHPYRIQLWQSIISRTTKNKIDLLESTIFSYAKRIIIEPQINELFMRLSLNKIPTIALTAMGTGKFGIIPKKEDLRIKELKNLGFSFLSLTPLQGEQEAQHLENTNIILPYSICKGIPLLKSGIIFTAGVDKGVVLEYILHKYNYFPEKVIFVDDCINNINSIKKLCIKLQIDFYGFHYRAVSLMPLPIINENLETLRFKILEQECKWLSYDKIQQA